MRVTVIATTEERHAFMPWLWWNFRQQTYANKELVLVDSSRHGVMHPGDSNIHIIRAIPKTSIGAKLNVAIAAATGDVVTRFDDDDWQHPNQLAWKALALQVSPHSVVGFNYGWFVELESNQVHPYRGLAGWLVPITAALPRDLALAIPFPNASLQEDVAWFQAIAAKTRAVVISDEVVHSFWLRHSRNTTRRFRRASRAPHISDLIAQVGLERWSDTGAELAQLRARLFRGNGDITG